MRAAGFRFLSCLLLGTLLVLPVSCEAEGSSDAPAGPGGLGWYRDYRTALSVARELDRPLFVAFTDPRCAPCVRMEEEVFPHPAVAEELRGFTRAWLRTTASTDAVTNLGLMSATFGTERLPLYVALEPHGRAELGRRSAYADSVQEFAAFLRTCREAVGE